MSNSKIDRIKAKSLERMALFERENIDMDKRTVSIAFSSEEPVERWFGTEILDHSPNSVRLGRLRDGGPVLVGHDSRDHVGVIESVSIDQDRRGRALVRFGKSARAEEIFQDVVDGIRRSVSVGYRIHEAVLEKTSDSGDTYRVTDWEPYEVSIVSVPADATVGVGRSDDDIGGSQNETLQREEHPMPDKDKQTPPSAEDRQDPAVNVEEVRAKAREEEKARIRYIEQVGQKYDQPELARQFIENGRSMEEFNAALLERIGKSEDQVSTPVEVDMSDAEHREFSIVRALNASVTGDWSSAGLEREVSREIAKQLGRDTEGVFIPTNLRAATGERALNTGTATAGGNTVFDEPGDLIELLRNRMMVRRLGARVLSDLQGDMPFPRQTASATLYWTGENPGSDVTYSEATFDQPRLQPKTAQATTAYSRQLLAQSSLDIENFVRDDLLAINALGLDLAAINGSGAANQPLGIINTTGIGVVAIGTDGGAPTWNHITQLEQEVAIDNADVGTLAYLTNAIMRGKLKRTEKATGTAQFVWGDRMGGEAGFGELNGYSAAVSNQVPSNLTKGVNNDCSAILFGNWNDLLIGEWGVIELITDPYALKKQGLIEVTSIMMVDIMVRHPQSFAAILDARDV